MALYLVDGHALAYRAYYAFAAHPLINSKGEETSAVYGFINTVLAIMGKYSPPYLAVAFDTRDRTFRHDRYEEYKANRVQTPESLSEQLPVIQAVLDAMRIPYLVAPGYEADDIIATIARRCRDTMPVRIVSGDKDFFQMVDDRIKVIRPGKANVLEKETGPEELLEHIGLRPDQIVDYLALMGDSSDNIPGVAGVGEKTAKKLLAEFDTLASIYDHLDEVKSASVRKKLEASRELAFLSRDLVTLKYDVPLNFTVGDFATREFRTDEFDTMLRELEFSRMREALFARGNRPRPDRRAATAPDPKPQPARAVPEASYELVNDEKALSELARAIADLEEIAIDTETSSVDAMQAVLAGISISTRPGRAYYVPVTSQLDEGELSLLPGETAPGLPIDVVQKHLGAPLVAARPAKIGQNIKYDEIVLERAGLPVGGISFDTMLASYCLEPGRRSHSLDALALELCGHEMIHFEDLFSARARARDIRRVPLEKVTEYAAEDADYTLRLKEIFAPLLEVSQVRTLFFDVEMPLREVLTRMQMTGVRVDTVFLGELSRRYTREIEELEGKIYALVGEEFNINSTQKLREILFERLGLQPSRKTKTGFSTDSDVLSGLAQEHEVISLLLRYRQLMKLKSTYVDALPRLTNPDTGRVHTSYNQAVTTTGRLSSSDPNLQNIPIRTEEGRTIRRAFVAREPGWVLLDADYSQIELRILAHLSGDVELVKAFHDDADVHRRTAARVFGVPEDDVSDEMRSRAKAVNFGMVYGQGARGLAQSLNIDVEEARTFINDYFASYPGVKRFIDETIMTAREQGVTTTMMGRVRHLPDINSGNGRLRSFSERIAVNTQVQGTAADIIKIAMLEVDAAIATRGLQSRMILQVHDELLFDVPEGELEEMRSLVTTAMESAAALAVPLKVDIGAGSNWLEAH